MNSENSFKVVCFHFVPVCEYVISTCVCSDPSLIDTQTVADYILHMEIELFQSYTGEERLWKVSIVASLLGRKSHETDL